MLRPRPLVCLCATGGGAGCPGSAEGCSTTTGDAQAWTQLIATEPKKNSDSLPMRWDAMTTASAPSRHAASQMRWATVRSEWRGPSRMMSTVKGTEASSKWRLRGGVGWGWWWGRWRQWVGGAGVCDGGGEVD